MNMIRIGMIQMKVEFHEAQKNLLHADKLVAQAAAEGAQLCILPECMDLGWGTPQARQLAQPIPGDISRRLCDIARKHGVWLVSGLTEREGDSICNAALLISDEGEILHKHRKINILTGVEDVYTVGDRIAVTDTPFGKIGISICADNSVQSLCIGHTLARMGAQMLLSPCAWAVRPDRDVVAEPYGNEWHVPYGELSGTYGIPVIGVSNVGEIPMGTWAGWKAIGNSIAYGADGKPLAVLPYGENAECVRIIDVEIRKPALCGTALSEYVYNGLK